MTTEEWKSLPNWPSYSVSNLGRVRGPKGDLRIQYGGEFDYPKVRLYDRGRQETIRVHREVCIAFNGPPPFEGAKALHRDGNRNNCCATNLYWGTQEQNAADMIEHKRDRSGERSPTSKLTWDKVRSARKRRAEGWTIPSLAKEMQVSECAMSKALSGLTWKEGRQ